MNEIREGECMGCGRTVDLDSEELYIGKDGDEYCEDCMEQEE